MPDDPAKRSKRDALKRHGTLNPHPDVVTDPLFQTGDFFDPDDLVQVKYEMLRRVRVDKHPVSQSASAFGFSRPTYYQAEADFQRDGVMGLLPEKRGPPPRPQAHVGCSGLRCPTPCKRSVRPPSGFGRSHSAAVRHNGPPAQHRTRVGPAGKKTPLNPANGARNTAEPQALISAYEELREEAAGSSSSGGLGMALFLGQGMVAWMQACSWVASTAPDNLRRCSTVCGPLPDDLRGEVVLVLAAMALNQALEVHP
jgi:hypothetical protein